MDLPEADSLGGFGTLRIEVGVIGAKADVRRIFSKATGRREDWTFVAFKGQALADGGQEVYANLWVPEGVQPDEFADAVRDTGRVLLYVRNSTVMGGGLRCTASTVQGLAG